MNSTLNYLRSYRSWLVENVRVSGSWPAAFVPVIALEGSGAQQRVVMAQPALGGTPHTFMFADLIDFRGAHLPATLNKAKVIILPRGGTSAVIVGPETATGFALAATSDRTATATVDLWIVELGRDA